MNRTLENALQILVYLSLQKADQLTPLTEISAHLDASPTYLAKVAALLGHAQLINTQRGMSGGMKLHKEPAKITFLNIWNACQQEIMELKCQGNSAHPCGLHLMVQQIREDWNQSLNQWTLEDLLHQLPTENTANSECLLRFARQLHATIAPMELP
jgi:Rrf2 family nitric oxide-sensitive transcriptional repressor